MTLRLLHGARKAHLLQFLYDSMLIIPDNLYINLFEADLTGANLTGVDLTCAQLVGANLSRANLRQADLTGSDLTEANLSGADLTMAKLTGANLAWADLRMAKLRAIYDRTTIWPDGFDPQGAGAKKQDTP